MEDGKRASNVGGFFLMAVKPTMYNMIQPLLNNLQKNPEKDYIYWPNRMEKVEAFGDSLTAVYKG